MDSYYLLFPSSLLDFPRSDSTEDDGFFDVCTTRGDPTIYAGPR